ncbi:hypothetical protein [Pectobacterium phage Wc4-1]|uniref:Uncharacterized protein n=1 Tax=Pectobacterium phage Wc4 TaxID=2652428 RepID=A0A5P8D4G3_9CAUD|nr:hypothetical protein [Pectobacterium phage Wc4]QFP94029.1 hypothetical protein [Pectobacterium phage Wc4-1]
MDDLDLLDNMDFEQAERDAAKRVAQIDEQNTLPPSEDGDDECAGGACKI